MKQANEEKINKKTKKKFKKEIILPLYFGWELVLRKVYDLKKHIVGPFKEYWQYITAVFVLILIVSTGLILHNNPTAFGATYGWIQSTWIGGADTGAVATHTSNQSNWTKYFSKDTNVVAGDTLTLSSGSSSVEDTTTAQFDAGANTDGDAPIIHTGDELKLTWTCGTNSVTYSGTVYPTVLIGTQCWLAKNLNVGTYVTGVTGQTDNSTIEKYCYLNNTANCTTYGGLYQWDEAMQYTETAGTKGICPTGWHIPTDAQQNTLDQYLKDTAATCDANRNGTWDCTTAGGKMKETGTSHWTTPNEGATNSSGFTALPAGYRNTDGTFANLGTFTYFWSSSVSGGSAWSRYLKYSSATVGRYAIDQAFGFSVRCLKD